MTTSNESDQTITTMAELEALYPEPVYPPAKVKGRSHHQSVWGAGRDFAVLCDGD